MLAAAEAVEMEPGGVSLVSRACGLSRVTLTKGVEELQAAPLAPGRIRRRAADVTRLTSQRSWPGARWMAWSSHGARRPGVAAALDLQEHAHAGGGTDGPGHPVSHEKVAQLLRTLDYSLQGNRKTEEGADHPDRDAQFRHINAPVKTALA